MSPRRIPVTPITLWLVSFALWFAIAGCQSPPRAAGQAEATTPIAQAHAVFTVAESKRLIAKAVVLMPIVRNALRNGTVIVCKGTTNTYVAEEFLGREIPHGAYVIGRVLPEKGGSVMPPVEPVPEVVLVKGRHRPDLTIEHALEQLGPGDVVIKGGNALDYANKVVGVWIGSPTGGTVGKIMPIIAARKAHLVIPIGLEKQVAGDVRDIAAKTTEPVDSPAKLPRMRLLTGHIVTEIEALNILAGVDAFQASAGGVGGAEGAVWMAWRGPRENVEKARRIAESIHGEEPFIP
ncbi:MAG TPA: hypothetical protein VLM89_07485 [Phycisphaerae bacterium]|nr:hypothetical protein [Phycisphaerae bacterium]